MKLARWGAFAPLINATVNHYRRVLIGLALTASHNPQ